MQKQSHPQKKPFYRRYIIAVSVILFLISAILREIVAMQLNKDPNDLGDEDFAKITELPLNNRYINSNKRLKILYDLESLKKFTNLQVLQLVNIKFPESKIPKWMRMLEKFGIINTKERFVIDLTPLEKLTHLKKLNLQGTPIKNIKPLSNLSDLENLYLANTFISDLEPIKELVNLQLLSVSNTHISNLEPVKGLINLETLNISNTLISNLEPLNGLKELKNLFIITSENITDKQVQELQKALPDLKLDYWGEPIDL